MAEFYPQAKTISANASRKESGVTYFYTKGHARPMGSLSEARTYGGIGSLLMLIGGIAGIFIPFGAVVIPIVGLILVLIAVKYIADVLKKPDIFTNYIIFFVLGIIALVVLIGFVFAAVISYFGLGGTGFQFVETPTDGDILALFGVIIIGAVIAWIIYIISAIFYRRSFDAISSGLGVSMFGTAALVFLIGAILIVIVIGVLIILIAGILQIVAFFSIPDQPPQPMVAAPPPMT